MWGLERGVNESTCYQAQQPKINPGEANSGTSSTKLRSSQVQWHVCTNRHTTTKNKCHKKFFELLCCLLFIPFWGIETESHMSVGMCQHSANLCILEIQYSIYAGCDGRDKGRRITVSSKPSLSVANK